MSLIITKSLISIKDKRRRKSLVIFSFKALIYILIFKLFKYSFENKIRQTSSITTKSHQTSNLKMASN